MNNKRILPPGVGRNAKRAGWSVLLAALAALAGLLPVHAAAQDAAHHLGAGAFVSDQPLQELLKKRRPKGLIYIAVPQAMMVANEGGNKKPSCSPQIQLTNSSNQTLEELVVGIRYKKAGKVIGSTLSRFYLIKTGKQDMHLFPSVLDTSGCEDATGEAEVIQCLYDTGESCVHDVRALEYGAVPLKIQDKK
jgi:hypothetical protein